MSYQNRRVSSQLGNTRTVSYSGGLNERFSSLEKKKNTQNGGGNTGGSVGGGNNGGTVFSRLRGGKTTATRGGRVNAIQSRLGKTTNGGIKKRLPTVTTNNAGRRGGARGGARGGNDNRSNVKNTGRGGSGGRKGMAAAVSKKPRTGNGKQTKKPLTAEDLDKQMDSYMMKDKKTAQAKLDDELNSYMAEAPAIELEEL